MSNRAANTLSGVVLYYALLVANVMLSVTWFTWLQRRFGVPLWSILLISFLYGVTLSRALTWPVARYERWLAARAARRSA